MIGEVSSVMERAQREVPVERAVRAAARPGRFVNIDRVRVLALLDIVAFHVNSAEHALGGFGLPTFLLFTVALNSRRRVWEPTGRFLTRKAGAFLAPWVAWCAVYAALAAATAIRHGRPAFEWFSPWMLISGTSYHLWYLPFAVLAGAAAHVAHRATARLPVAVVVWGGVAMGLVLVAGHHWLSVAPLHVMGAWALGLPLVPMGVALGRCLGMAESQERARWLLAYAAVAGCGCAAVALLLSGTPGLRCGAAAGIAAAAAMLPGRADPVTTVLTRLRFGVYLVHPLFIVEYAALTGGAENRIVEFFVVLAASAALVAAIRMTPMRGIVSTPGEPGRGGSAEC